MHLPTAPSQQNERFYPTRNCLEFPKQIFRELFAVSRSRKNCKKEKKKKMEVSNFLLVLCITAATASGIRSDCGAPPTPLNTSTPNVLIIGDSITLGFGVSPTDTGYGYGLNVAKMMGGPYQAFYSKQLAGGLGK
jgi:hypothetical protein